MKSHYLLLTLLLILDFPEASAQASDTMAAYQLLQKGESFWKSGQWDSVQLSFGKAAEAWKMQREKGQDSIVWERYFHAKSRAAGAYYRKGEYRQADAVYRKMIPELREKAGTNRLLLAKTLRLAGYAALRNQRLEASISIFQESLAIYREVLPEGDEYFGVIFRDLGYANDLFDKPKVAIEWYQAAVNLWEPMDSLRLELGMSYSTLGDLFAYVQNYPAAIKHYQLGLPILKYHEDFDYYHDLHGLAVAYLDFDRYEKAAEYFRKVLPIYRDYNDLSYSVCLINLGLVSEGLGDYELADDYFQQALPILEALGDPYYIGSCLLNMGILHESMHEYEASRSYYQQAAGLFEASDDAKYPIALAGLSRVSLAMDDPASSLAFAQQGLEAERRVSDENSNFLELSHVELGNAYRGVGNYAQAFAQYDIATELCQNPEKAPFLGEIWVERARTYECMAQPMTALESYHQALLALLEDYDTPEFLSNPSFADRPFRELIYKDVLLHKAQSLVALAKGRMEYLHAADTAFQLAVSSLDRARLSYRNEGSKLDIQESNQLLLTAATEFCVDLYDQTGDPSYLHRSLNLTERAKTTVLYEMIQSKRARSFGDLPAELLSVESELRVEINRLSEMVFDLENRKEADSVNLSKLRFQVFNKQQQYDSLMSSLEERYPGYEQIRQQSTGVSPSAIQKALKADEAFLSYFLLDSSLLVYVFTQSRFQLFRLPISTAFFSQIEAFRQALLNPSISPDAYQQLAYPIYQQVLEPLSEIIAGKDLLISPDGILATIPFEALLSKPKGKGPQLQYSSLPFVIMEHQVAYTYSASFLVQDRDGPSEYYAEVLAFAPSFNDQGERDLSNQALAYAPLGDTLRGGLSTLRGTFKEIEYLQTKYGAQTYQSLEATESRFKSLTGKGGILHLATHAIINHESPRLSYLLFTQDGDTMNDGNLYAWELYNLELHAQMAVLSACNTGFGKLQKGEGVMSLGRAFAYTGVKGIVMSLWPAEDESTADLMANFYDNIAEGMLKDEALQAAKLEFLSSVLPTAQHPFYWAGFVVQGNTSPLVRNKWMNIFGWTFALGLAILILIWTTRKTWTRK